MTLIKFNFLRISPAEWTNPYPCIEEPDSLENQFSLINSFWFTVGSLMQQGSDVAPMYVLCVHFLMNCFYNLMFLYRNHKITYFSAISTRMAASIWWFFTLIMVSSYTANLAAFLTIENPEIMFKDIEGLVKLKDMKYGAKRDGSTANFFRVNTFFAYILYFTDSFILIVYLRNTPDLNIFAHWRIYLAIF